MGYRQGDEDMDSKCGGTDHRSVPSYLATPGRTEILILASPVLEILMQPWTSASKSSTRLCMRR